jgi:hypothetical protein
MPGNNRRRAKTVQIIVNVPTPASSNVDPAFFSQITSPQRLLVAPAPVAHSQSKTWKSSDAKDRDQYNRLATLLYHFAPNSPFVPRNYGSWVEHRAAIKTIEMENVKRDIAIKEGRNAAAAKTQIKGFLNGKKLRDKRTAILCFESIWSLRHVPTEMHPEALWPDRTELQYEGDARSKSKVGRFFPLPRKPGNATVNWKARVKLPPFRPLDHVGMFREDGTPDIEMRMGSEGLGDGMQVEELIEGLVGKELIAEL